MLTACTSTLYLLLLSTALLLDCCEAYCTDSNNYGTKCFSEGDLAAGVIVPPLSLTLVVGGIVIVVVIIVWRKQLKERFSLWRKSRSGDNNEHNIEMDNPTYSPGDLPDMNPLSSPPSTPRSTTSPQIPFYESVELLIENHVDTDDPNYDVVDNVISEVTASLQCQPSQRRFSIQRCNSDGKAVTAYAVTAVADEIPTVADQEVEILNNGIVNQEIKKINKLTRSPIQKHLSAVGNKPVAKSAKPTNKPDCPPKPNSLLTAKYGLKKSSSCPAAEDSKYSKLDPLTSYASLEPHIENPEKGTAPSNPTKENYSHLVR